MISGRFDTYRERNHFTAENASFCVNWYISTVITCPSMPNNSLILIRFHDNFGIISKLSEYMAMIDSRPVTFGHPTHWLIYVCKVISSVDLWNVRVIVVHVFGLVEFHVTVWVDIGLVETLSVQRSYLKIYCVRYNLLSFYHYCIHLATKVISLSKIVFHFVKEVRKITITLMSQPTPSV